MSDILNSAAMQPIPKVDDLYIVTVGTTATSATDLFDELGVDGNQDRARVTIEADGVVYVVGGADDSMGAPVIAATSASGPTGRCKRIPADSPRSFFVRRGRRWVRFIAAEADTRVEVSWG